MRRLAIEILSARLSVIILTSNFPYANKLFSLNYNRKIFAMPEAMDHLDWKTYDWNQDQLMKLFTKISTDRNSPLQPVAEGLSGDERAALVGECRNPQDLIDRLALRMGDKQVHPDSD